MSYVQQAKVQSTLILRYELCTGSQGPKHHHPKVSSYVQEAKVQSTLILRYELCTGSQGPKHPHPKV